MSSADFISPFLRASGNGQVDINRETLDFKLTPKFVKSPKGKGDERQLSGVMVPVFIGGTFQAPSFRPDIKGIVQMIPEETVSELLEKPKEKVDEILKNKKDSIDKILKPKKDEQKSGRNEPSKKIEDKVGDFIKKFPF